jgi:hypothetical protein
VQPLAQLPPLGLAGVEARLSAFGPVIGNRQLLAQRLNRALQRRDCPPFFRSGYPIGRPRLSAKDIRSAYARCPAQQSLALLAVTRGRQRDKNADNAVIAGLSCPVLAADKPHRGRD